MRKNRRDYRDAGGLCPEKRGGHSGEWPANWLRAGGSLARGRMFSTIRRWRFPTGVRV